MNIILCVDNKNGMLFNNRRQSRDRCVIEDILKLTEGSRLLISDFSSRLFENTKAEVSDNILDIAGKKDYCFVENIDITPYEKTVDSIITYCWNKVYPADFYFNTDMSLWKLKEEIIIKGYSHNEIIRRIYVK